MFIIWFVVLLGGHHSNYKVEAYNISALQCGYNEMPVECKTFCPPQNCDISYTEYDCTTVKFACVQGCDCLPGFLRNSSGICIFNEECPPPIVCPVNEEPSSCKIICPPQTCMSIYTLYNCLANIECKWGCNCVSGYLRNSSGICVPSNECPTTPPLICGYNEVESPCKIICPPDTCDSIFTSYICENNSTCERGCNCKDQYLRNSSGICVPSEECFLDTCDIPSECRLTCANPKPKNCPSVDQATENQDGCKCKPGYILSYADGKCITIEECPDNIGCNGDDNARVKQCPQPCPSTCQSPNATPCRRKCDAIGCECKTGYLKSENDGRCVLADDCYGGNPCGPNGTFVECKYKCNKSYCPTSNSRVQPVCETAPFAPCFSGCMCKLNFRMLSVNDPSCRRADECPPVKCGCDEIWDSCPSPCYAGYCNEVDQPRGVCNTLVQNCDPQCVCREGMYRNPYNERCVSARKCRKINKIINREN